MICTTVISACIQKQYVVVVTTQAMLFLKQNLKNDDSSFYKLSCRENLLVESFHETCSRWMDVGHVSPYQGACFHVSFYHIKSTSCYINMGHVLNHWLKWKELQRYYLVHRRNAFAFVITNVTTQLSTFRMQKKNPNKPKPHTVHFRHQEMIWLIKYLISTHQSITCMHCTPCPLQSFTLLEQTFRK